MKYYFILAMIAVLIAFSVPTQTTKPSPDGINIETIKTIKPISTALAEKQPITLLETEKPPEPPQIASQGGCIDWVRTAGIGDVQSALELIQRESGCRVNAGNPDSGAFGIPQALPGSKMASAGADWETNPITQLRWMNTYVLGRYGSWANALATQKSRCGSPQGCWY